MVAATTCLTQVEALITSPMASVFAVRPNSLRCPEGSGYIWERSVLLRDAVTDHRNHQYAVLNREAVTYTYLVGEKSLHRRSNRFE